MKIGYSPVTVKAYCRRCNKIFVYHYNSVNPLRQDGRCPKCKRSDRVVTSDHIDTQIMLLRTIAHHPINDDEENIRDLRREVHELLRIKRELF